MKEVLKSRFGGSWDGEEPEIHGLIELGGRKLKVELLYVKATEKWQCCIFEEGEVLTIVSGEEVVLLVGKAVAGVM